MPGELRIPITNTIANTHYTMGVSLAAGTIQYNVLLDTGAGLFVVDGAPGGYDPATDAAAKTTRLLQTATFETGSFMAAVVQAPVGLPVAGLAAPVMLPNANVAVTYQNRPGLFGNADGILGLAYAALDTALRMPADTFRSKYPADQIHLGQPADLDPFVTQLADAGLAPDIFAFSVRRSITSEATDDPESDPLNSGLFILGSGYDCTDLFSGTFTHVAVVHEHYYGTNLQAVQVGGQTIPVPPVAPGVRAFSNSIIDSGAFILQLDQGLYTKIIAAFEAFQPGFGETLQAGSASAGAGCDQGILNLAAWPKLTLVFQGSDGVPAPVDIAPRDYWQFDCRQKGQALAMITGDGGSLAGQSILGLPLFAGHFVVFDRTASNGHGVISFADHAEPAPLIA